MCLYILRDTAFQIDNYLLKKKSFTCGQSCKDNWQDRQPPKSVVSYIRHSLILISSWKTLASFQ